MPDYNINIETPGLDRARQAFQGFARGVGDSARAVAVLTSGTLALAAAYGRTRRLAASAAAAIAGIPSVIRLTAAGFAVAAVALDRFLDGMERVGDSERSLRLLAGQIGVSRAELRRLQVTAAITGESVEDLASSVDDWTASQREAYEAARDLTIVLSSGYSQAAQEYAASVAVLEDAQENFRSNFLGVPQLIAEAATELNNFRARTLVLLNNALNNLADDASEPFEILARHVLTLAGLQERTTSLAQATRDLQAAQLEQIRATRTAAATVSAADREYEALLSTIRSIQELRDVAIGADAAGAEVRAARNVQETEERRLALLLEITEAARRESRLRTDLEDLIARQRNALEAYRGSAGATASEILRLEENVTALESALAGLDPEVEVVKTAFEELDEQIRGLGQGNVQTLRNLQVIMRQLSIDIANAENPQQAEQFRLSLIAAAQQAAALSQEIDAALDPAKYAEAQANAQAYSQVWQEVVGNVQETERLLEQLAVLETNLGDNITEQQQALIQAIRDRLAGNEAEEPIRTFADQVREHVEFGLQQAVSVALSGDVEGAVLLFSTFVSDTLQAALSQAIVNAFLESAAGQSLTSFFTGILGGLTGASAGTPAGAQFGGITEPGRAYVVGEQGPELFIPGRGRIVRNSEAFPEFDREGGAGTNLTFNITGDVSRQTRRVVREDARFIAQDVNRVRRERGEVS